MNFKNNELLMLGGAFILGVFVDRYMNHRDIVTGEVKEGLPDVETVGIIGGVCIGIVLLLTLSLVLFHEFGWFYLFWFKLVGRSPSTQKAHKYIMDASKE
jgi:hypothetical protein